MIRSLTALMLAAAAAPALAQSKVDFKSQIWPILEKRCIECHSAPSTDSSGKVTKPKGRVELDSLSGIQKSKRGQVVVAGDGEGSLLYELTTLPEGDEDIMPPSKKGKPLTKKETDLIRKWIDDGADFGKWTGADSKASAGSGSKPTRSGNTSGSSRSGRSGKPKESPLAALAKGLKPIPEATLDDFAKGPFRITSVGDESPLLQVTSFGQTDAIDDAAVAELLPLAANIAELDLATTQITDEVGATLARMPRLVTLDLRQTSIGDHGVAALIACKELRCINLYGTKVGDYGAGALIKLQHLEELYLWQTEVSAKTVVSLQEANPGLRVVLAAELPEPMDDDGNTRRRRRGQ